MHYCSIECHNSTENHSITLFLLPHLTPHLTHLSTLLPTPPLTPLSLPLPNNFPITLLLIGPPSFQQTPPSLSLILELFKNGSFEDIVLSVPHFRNLDHVKTSSLQTCRACDLLVLGINHFFGGQQKNKDFTPILSPDFKKCSTNKAR